MTKNDKYSLLIVGIGSIVFIAGLFIHNAWLIALGGIAILTGAGAYGGKK